jgi:hypothetical protein
MALLLFIRSFPARAVVFLAGVFQKAVFGQNQEVGSKKQIFRKAKE